MAAAAYSYASSCCSSLWKAQGVVKCIIYAPITILVLGLQYVLRAVWTVFSVIVYVIGKIIVSINFVRRIIQYTAPGLEKVSVKIKSWADRAAGITRDEKGNPKKIGPTAIFFLSLPGQILDIFSLFVGGLAPWLGQFLSVVVVVYPIVFFLGDALSSLEYAPGAVFDTTAAFLRGIRSVINTGIETVNTSALLVNPWMPYEWVFVFNAAKIIIDTTTTVQKAVGVTASAFTGQSRPRTLLDLTSGTYGKAAESISTDYAVNAAALNNVLAPIISVVLQIATFIFKIFMVRWIQWATIFIKIGTIIISSIACLTSSPAAIGCVILEIFATILNTVIFIPINNAFPFLDLYIPVCGEPNSGIPINEKTAPCECSGITGGPLSGVPSCPAEDYVCYSYRGKGAIIYGEYDRNKGPIRADIRGSTARTIEEGCPNYIREQGSGRRLDVAEDEEVQKCFYSEEHKAGWLVADIADTSKLAGSCVIDENGVMHKMSLTDEQSAIHLRRYLSLPHVSDFEKNRFSKTYIPKPKFTQKKRVYTREEAIAEINEIYNRKVESGLLGVDCSDLTGEENFALLIFRLTCFVRKVNLAAYGEGGIVGHTWRNSGTARKLEEVPKKEGPRGRRYLLEIHDILTTEDKPLSRRLVEIHSVIYAMHKEFDPDAVNIHEFLTHGVHAASNRIKQESHKHWEEMHKTSQHFKAQRRIRHHAVQRRSLQTTPNSDAIGDLDIGGCGVNGILCPDGTCAKDALLSNCKAMTQQTASVGGTIRLVSYQAENIFENLNLVDFFKETWACYKDILDHPEKNPANLDNLRGRSYNNMPNVEQGNNIQLWNPGNIRWCAGMVPYFNIYPVITADLMAYIHEQCQETLDPPDGVQPCQCPQYFKGAIMRDFSSFWVLGMPMAFAASLFNGYKAYQYMLTRLPISGFLSGLWQSLLFFFPASSQTEEVINVFNPVFAAAGMGPAANNFCILLHIWSVFKTAVVIYITFISMSRHGPWLIATFNLIFKMIWFFIVDPCITFLERLGSEPLNAPDDAVMLTDPTIHDDPDKIALPNSVVTVTNGEKRSAGERVWGVLSNFGNSAAKAFDSMKIHVKKAVGREREEEEDEIMEPLSLRDMYNMYVEKRKAPADIV